MNTVFCLVLALATVQAQRTCMEKMYGCTNYYNERPNTDREAMCVSLTIYRRCLTNIKESTPSCQSNMRYQAHASSISFLLEENNCSDVSVANFSFPQPMTPPARGSACGLLRRKSNAFSAQKHCSLFGDPHLRTFSENTETCVVQGAWPMVDNQYLAVQVTNVYLLPGQSVATATSKITVVIKRQKGCSKQKTYQASISRHLEQHRLPAAFVDGSQETGPKECPARVYEIISGVLIHIDICYIKTKIVIRKAGHFLTFHIRMPQEIVGNTTKGLCVSGCPKRERIDYRELLSLTDKELQGRTKLTRREATKKCTDANVKGFYMDSCLFDLLTTGDANFSAAAKSAMDDALSLDPLGTHRGLQTYNVTVPRSGKPGGGGGIRPPVNAASGRGNCRFFLLLLSYLLVFISS